jgi:hypothetical protein
MASMLHCKDSLGRILVLALILGFAIAPSFAADEASRDVVGWREATWGMTSEQLVGLFGKELQKLDERLHYGGAYVDYVIPNYELVGSRFTVRFQMAEAADSLQQIFIALDDTNLAQTFLYDELESLLTRRYGQGPTYSNDSAAGSIVSRSREWVFPTTTVALYYSYFRTIGEEGLSIVYSQTTTGDAAKL